MENLGSALLHYRINFSHSRVVLLLCSPLLLLMLAVIIPHWGALMPTMRRSLSSVFEAPSTSAFFLLNALIWTIIGRSKLEAARGKLVAQALEGSSILSTREAVGQLQYKKDGSRRAVHAENTARTEPTVGKSYDIGPSILTNGHGYDQHVSDQRRKFLVRSRSLSAGDNHLSEKTSTRHAEVSTAVVNDQHKPFNSTRLRIARNYTSGREKARPPIPRNPLLHHGLVQNTLMRGSFSNVHAVGEGSQAAIEPASKKSPMIHAYKARRAGQRPNNSMLVPAAATAHSSFENVWAGIIAANAANSQHRQHAANPCDEGSPRGDTTQSRAVVAVPSRRPAAATSEPGVPPPSTAAAANASPKAEAARTSAVAAAASAGPATETAEVAEKKNIANDHEHDSELEELNRRAEEFITRFNHQIRIQRQESLQRKRGSHLCNHNYIENLNYHVQHPSPGLLVG